MEEEEVNDIDSGNECVVDNDIKEECNGEDENLEAESKSPKFPKRCEGEGSTINQNYCVDTDTGIVESDKMGNTNEEEVEETNEKNKEEESISSMDPRKQSILFFLFIIFTI